MLTNFKINSHFFKSHLFEYFFEKFKDCQRVLLDIEMYSKSAKTSNGKKKIREICSKREYANVNKHVSECLF